MNAPAVAPAPQPAVSAGRVDTVDLLRGIVMVVMALDHTRDFFHSAAVRNLSPTDLTQASAALFLTRWITHFCAPIFCLLAGTGAYLSVARGRTPRELSWFLVTRGGWLIFLELTFFYVVMNWAWPVHFDWALILWALGWSMIVLAALIHLPLWVSTVFGLVLILGHNALDGVRPASWGSWSWLWQILHVQGVIAVTPSYNFLVAYPLIPWIGVMAVGYSLGAFYDRTADRRRPRLIWLGLTLTAAFVLLRCSNLYGDPNRWAVQPGAGFTVLSFLNCAKYPPSLCFLLMTLGPGILLLGLLERLSPSFLRPFLVFGRVPFFYYLLHLPLLHGLSAALNVIRFGHPAVTNAQPGGLPADAGVSLGTVYFIWLIVVVALYPACRRFADLKRRRRDVWLSYL